jgi:hypothetical protein
MVRKRREKPESGARPIPDLLPKSPDEFSIDTPLFSLYKTEDSVMFRFFNDIQTKEEAS